MSVWPTKPLADLLSFMTSGSRGWAEHYRESGDLFLRIQNVGKNRILLDDITFVDPPRTAEARRTLVQPGDLLLSITADLGRTAVVPEGIGRAFINQHLAILRLQNVHPPFVSAFFASPEGQKQVMRRNKHAVKAGLNFDDIRSFQIPLPPLPEQKRIAEILDRAEALRAKRRAALAQLDSLTQSIFLDLFGDPVANPKRWNRVPFSEILEHIDSGTSPKCLDRPVQNGEWGVLKLGAVTYCVYDPTENKALPPSLEPDPSIEVMKGNLLFARKNTYELVAACAYVEETPPHLMMSDLIFRLRLKSNALIVPRFLHQLLIYSPKRAQIQKLASGSAGSMPNISKQRLATVEIEMPPLKLQNEFARRAAAVEKLKTAHRQSLANLDSLFASLQHRAFRGEL